MKQIIAMMLSASPPRLGAINGGLQRFVWNAQAKGLPEGIEIYAALTRNQNARQAGAASKLIGQTGEASFFSEVVFAPFILVMTLGHKPPPDRRLVRITYFANAGYGDRQITGITLPLLRPVDFYPGAYE